MRKCVSSTILIMLAMLLFVQGVAAAVSVPFRVPRLGETIIATADDLLKG